jgi:hypothetical protein
MPTVTQHDIAIQVMGSAAGRRTRVLQRIRRCDRNRRFFGQAKKELSHYLGQATRVESLRQSQKSANAAVPICQAEHINLSQGQFTADSLGEHRHRLQISQVTKAIQELIVYTISGCITGHVD